MNRLRDYTVLKTAGLALYGVAASCVGIFISNPVVASAAFAAAAIGYGTASFFRNKQINEIFNQSVGTEHTTGRWQDFKTTVDGVSWQFGRAMTAAGGLGLVASSTHVDCFIVGGALTIIGEHLRHDTVDSALRRCENQRDEKDAMQIIASRRRPLKGVGQLTL